MSNLLEVAMIDVILSLHRRNWSQRRIAKELGINRETVARYLKQAEAAPKPANAPPGSTASEAAPNPADAPSGPTASEAAPNPANAPSGSTTSEVAPNPANAPSGSTASEVAPNPANAPPGSAVIEVAPDSVIPPLGSARDSGERGHGRLSECEPWREAIQSKCDLGLSAQRIFQDLSNEHAFAGSYYSVRRFVRRLEPTREFPFRRLECEPGDEAQVDFGTGAPIVGPEGKRRRTHVFRIVLSHSRKAYSEVVYRQTTDNFLCCIENAFRHFGGAPRRLILDNLRAAVKNADWFDPELNPKVRSFGEYYGSVFWPTRPYTPRHKGKVEKGIDYVQDNALKGRQFPSLQEQNAFLHDWELTVADTRIHGTTRRQVGKHFVEVERAALVPLPLAPFPSYHESRRTVHRDGHVEVERAYYAVPPEYLAREVWVRWDARLVRIFNQRMEPIVVHTRKEPGRFSTPPELIAPEKISGVERGAAWLLGKVRSRLGPHSTTWAEAMIEVRGVEGVRVLLGLLSLAGRHPAAAIEDACKIAVGYGAYRLRTIRALIARQAPKQELLQFLNEHPIIRPMSDYSQWVHDAFQSQNRRNQE
jgi:transposase